MIGIYKFTNKCNRKVYIGQSVHIEIRYNEHLRDAEQGKKSLLCNALRKYGVDCFDFEVIHECSRKQLDWWEKFFIRYYCSNLNDYGYNLTEGGANTPTTKNRVQPVWNKGKKLTDKHVANMSRGQKKRYEDENEHIKLSIAHQGQVSPMKGKKRSEESKEKNRIGSLGRKQSEETIKKRKEKMKLKYAEGW